MRRGSHWFPFLLRPGHPLRGGSLGCCGRLSRGGWQGPAVTKASRQVEPRPDGPRQAVCCPFVPWSALWPLAHVLGGPRRSALPSGVLGKGRRKERGPGVASPETRGRHVVRERRLWGLAGTWSLTWGLGRCALTSPAWKAFQDVAIRCLMPEEPSVLSRPAPRPACRSVWTTSPQRA